MRKEKIRVGSLESKVTKLLQIRGIKEADPLYTAIFKMLADVGGEYLDAGYYDLAINRLNSLSLVSFLSVEPRTVRYYFRKLMKRIANKREIVPYDPYYIYHPYT